MIDELYQNKNSDRHTYIIENSQDVSDTLKRLQTKYEEEKISSEELFGKKTHYMKKPKILAISNCSINGRDLSTISEILSTLQTVSFSDCFFLDFDNDDLQAARKRIRTSASPIDLYKRSESTNPIKFTFEKILLSNLKFKTFWDFSNFLEIFFVDTEINELTFSKQDDNQTKSGQMQLKEKQTKTGKMQLEEKQSKTVKMQLEEKQSKTGKMQKQNAYEQQDQENNDYFLKILEENNHFKKLNKLELLGIHLTDNHAELIANNLYSSDLNYVDLSRNNIGDFGLISFSNNINVIPNNLESLILDNNDIGDLGVYNLAYSLRHNEKLRRLSLDSNHSLSQEAISLLHSTNDEPRKQTFMFGPYNKKVIIHASVDRKQRQKHIKQKTRRLSKEMKTIDQNTSLPLDPRVNTRFQMKILSNAPIGVLSVSQGGTNVLDKRILDFQENDNVSYLFDSIKYPDYDMNEPRYQDIQSVQDDILELQNQIKNVDDESTKDLQYYKKDTLKVLENKIKKMEELFLKKDSIKKKQQQQQTTKTLRQRLQTIKTVVKKDSSSNEQNTSKTTSSNEQNSSKTTSSNEQNNSNWQYLKPYIESLQEILGKENESLKDFRTFLLNRKLKTLNKIKKLFQDFQSHIKQNTQETNEKQQNTRQQYKKLEIVEAVEIKKLERTLFQMIFCIRANSLLTHKDTIALIINNIDFADIEFGDSSFMTFITYLQLLLMNNFKKGHFYSIEITNCNINDRQLYDLLVILGDCMISEHLKSIGLYNNNITNLGASILGSYLVHNSNIEILQLDENEIGDKGAMILARALQINNSLNILSLNNNLIRNPGIEELIQCLHSINISSSENHFPICSISLLGNPVDNNDTLAFLLKQLREKLDGANIFSDIFVINRNVDAQHKHIYEVTVKRIREGKKTFLLQDEDFIQWAQKNNLGRTYRQDHQQTTSRSVSSTSSSQRRTTQVSNEKFLQYITRELAQQNKKQKTYRAIQKHAQYVDYFTKQPITVDVNNQGRSTSSKEEVIENDPSDPADYINMENTPEIYLHERDPNKFMIDNKNQYFLNGYTFPDSGEAFRFNRNNFYSCSNDNNEEKIKIICNKIFQKYVNVEQPVKIQNQMEQIATIQQNLRKNISQETNQKDKTARKSRSLLNFGFRSDRLDLFYDLLDRKFVNDQVNAIEELALKEIDSNSIGTMDTSQKQDLVINTLLNLSEEEKKRFSNLFPSSFSDYRLDKKTKLRNYLFSLRSLGAGIGLRPGLGRGLRPGLGRGLGRGLPSLQNSGEQSG